MKIQYRGRVQDGRFLLTATPDSQDATPTFNELSFDWDPVFKNDDILSVAAVLAFGAQCSGPLTLPRHVSPEVAQAIEEFISPVWVSVSPITFEPRANPMATGRLKVTSDLSKWKLESSTFGEQRVESLAVLPASQFSGFITSPDGVIVASNAQEMAALGQPANYVLPFIAVAALYAETLHCYTIELESDLAGKIDAETFRSVQKLLLSCRLSLVMPGL